MYYKLLYKHPIKVSRESNEYYPRSIKRTKIGGNVISTIFLGLNYGLTSDKPVLFETLYDVMGESKIVRYSTYDDAIRGHKAACEIVKQNI